MYIIYIVYRAHGSICVVDATKPLALRFVDPGMGHHHHRRGGRREGGVLVLTRLGGIGYIISI